MISVWQHQKASWGFDFLHLLHFHAACGSDDEGGGVDPPPPDEGITTTLLLTPLWDKPLKPCSSCFTDNMDDSLDDLLGDLEHKPKTTKKTERPRSSSPAVPQKTETGESGDISHIWASHDWLWPLTSLSVPQRLQQLPWGRGTIWRLMMKMIWWTLWASEKQAKHKETDWHWKKRGESCKLIKPLGTILKYHPC